MKGTRTQADGGACGEWHSFAGMWMCGWIRWRSRPLGVVSHAHSDHAAWHAETVVTPATAALMRARRGFRNKVIHETGFDEPRNCGAARITLLPAWTCAGVGAGFLECEAGSVLFTRGTSSEGRV